MFLRQYAIIPNKQHQRKQARQNAIKYAFPLNLSPKQRFVIPKCLQTKGSAIKKNPTSLNRSTY